MPTTPPRIRQPVSLPFSMFGREPRLPVDFLLGRVGGPIGGNVHDWVQEHQALLQVAFKGAHERLKVAAERCKKLRPTCSRCSSEGGPVGMVARPWCTRAPQDQGSVGPSYVLCFEGTEGRGIGLYHYP